MKDLEQLENAGDSVNDYMLMLSLPAVLHGKVKEIKKEFSEKFAAPAALWGNTDIAIVTFRQPVSLEEKILEKIKMICESLPYFKLNLRGFNSYPTHNIHFQVESKKSVHELVKEFRRLQEILKFKKELKPHFLDNPNITLASRLLPWQYEKAWLEFQHRHFYASFIADQVKCLRKRQDENTFEVAGHFRFLNLPLATIPGTLFKT